MSVLWRVGLTMWLCVWLALIPPDVRSAHATQKRLPDDLRSLIAQGNPRDELPLIITLTDRWGIENMRATPISKAQRRSDVRRAQQAFVQRQSRNLTRIKGQTVVSPTMFVLATRDQIATLYNDIDVRRIVLDEPTPLAMYESNTVLGLQTSHEAGYDGSGTTVAVLDTGVLSTHELLQGRVIAEACFSSQNTDSDSLCSGNMPSRTGPGSAAPCDGFSTCTHGTHVAGIIAGNVITSTTGYAMRGVAPRASIIAVQVFSKFKNGTRYCSVAAGCILSWQSDQIAALDWLYDNHATPSWGTLAAVNMSLAGSAKYTAACDSDERKPYIDQLRTIGVATVIASGNSGFSDGISAPACISTAIAVGATQLAKQGATLDSVAWFSNTPTDSANQANADGDRLLDLLAPGHDVYSAMSRSTTAYELQSGTSMAAPHVAGAWALLKQVHPTASVSRILSWLYTTGPSITNTRNGVLLPRIHVASAVTAAVDASIALTATATWFTPVPTTTPGSETPTPSTTPTATIDPRPGDFVKVAPAHNLTNRALTMTLSWSESIGASQYQYCIATAAATCSRWIDVGAARTVVVSGLVSNRSYFWQVRAVNSAGVTVASQPVWRFATTAQQLPGPFAKSAPAPNLTSRSLTTTLSWNASNGAMRYEYCIATSARTCTNWVNVAGARSVVVRGLARNSTYFWQVRAINTAGLTLATQGVWRFSTSR